jgi:glycine/D-amino acid oxidase-like deaminating enzyme/nitrite reductase/ring-hydroxylating ferredoxin subunit
VNESKPIWRRHAPAMPHLQALGAAALRDSDVVVIGAGIAGVSIALALAENGRRATVLEKEAVGAGQTSRTSAQLANALDDRYYHLERWHGADGAREAAASHATAIDRIERWIEAYAIDCDFERIDGYLVGAGTDAREDAHELGRELEAATRAGLDVAHADAVPGLDAFGPALRFARQARFEPLAYLAGIAEAATSLGVRLVRANVVAVEGGERARVTTDDGIEIEADSVVVATNVPFHETVAIHTKQAAYRTFVLAIPIEPDAFPDVLLWDTCDPYHYLRRYCDRSDGSCWLIAGGNDHKTGQPADEQPYARLAAWVRERIGGLGEIEWRWSGQVIEPVDGLAFIGRDPGGEDNVYVVTGDSGNGLTHGTIAAHVIPALIAETGDSCCDIYDPRRTPLHALGTWLGENANVAAQYLDWLERGAIRPLANDDATIVRNGVHRIAVYRGADGSLCAFNAQCPHLGCSVRWNAIERTWDCPCHGSRFDPVDGRVINGPAAHGLAPLDAT